MPAVRDDTINILLSILSSMSLEIFSLPRCLTHMSGTLTSLHMAPQSFTASGLSDFLHDSSGLQKEVFQKKEVNSATLFRLNPAKWYSLISATFCWSKQSQILSRFKGRIHRCLPLDRRGVKKSLAIFYLPYLY